jgi:hypothetical protein
LTTLTTLLPLPFLKAVRNLSGRLPHFFHGLLHEANSSRQHLARELAILECRIEPDAGPSHVRIATRHQIRDGTAGDHVLCIPLGLHRLIRLRDRRLRKLRRTTRASPGANAFAACADWSHAAARSVRMFVHRCLSGVLHDAELTIETRHNIGGCAVVVLATIILAMIFQLHLAFF